VRSVLGEGASWPWDFRAASDAATSPNSAKTARRLIRSPFVKNSKRQPSLPWSEVTPALLNIVTHDLRGRGKTAHVFAITTLSRKAATAFLSSGLVQAVQRFNGIGPKKTPSVAGDNRNRRLGNERWGIRMGGHESTIEKAPAKAGARKPQSSIMH